MTIDRVYEATHCEIIWHKTNLLARIPTKRDTDAGYDIYTIEDNVWLEPGETRLFSTGLQYYISPGWWLMGFDRGSTGSQGINLHCGVCDNTYRGEVFICLHNDNNYPVYFTSQTTKVQMITEGHLWWKKQYLAYPISKAIAQLIPVAQPEVTSRECQPGEWEDLKNTDRGEGKLGSSGK